MSKRPTQSESTKLLSKFGSPLFVIYKESIIKNIGIYYENFNKYSGGFTLSYSVKTNSNPTILKIFRDNNVMAEVCSSLDIRAAKLAGYVGKDILFDGLVKDNEELAYAVKNNFSIINLESLDEAERLAEISKKFKKTTKVGIRLSFPSTRVGLKSLLGITYDRFGVSRESGEAEKIVKFVLSQKYLKLIGVHCHTGSNQKSAKSYLVGIDEVTAFMDLLKRKYKISISILNLGGGFGAPEITSYKISDFAIQAIRRFLSLPFAFIHRPINYSAMSQRIISYLEKKLNEYDLPYPHLMFEPGRSLIGNTTHLLTTAVETKKTINNNWAIIDAGTNLMPILTFYSEYHDIIVFGNSRSTIKTSLAGPLLYSSDSLASDRLLPKIKPGDVVMICDTGAYFSCQANQFLRSRPATVIVDGKKASIVERKETVEDIFNRSVI